MEAKASSQEERKLQSHCRQCGAEKHRRHKHQRSTSVPSKWIESGATTREARRGRENARAEHQWLCHQHAAQHGQAAQRTKDTTKRHPRAAGIPPYLLRKAINMELPSNMEPPNQHSKPKCSDGSLGPRQASNRACWPESRVRNARAPRLKVGARAARVLVPFLFEHARRSPYPHFVTVSRVCYQVHAAVTSSTRDSVIWKPATATSTR